MKRHDIIKLMKTAKFATLVDEKVLKEIRFYAKNTGVQISKIVSDALQEYLQKYKIRPAFRKAMDDVINENEELLSRLAK